MFDDGCHGNMENKHPHMMAQQQASSSERPLQQQQQVVTENHSLNSSGRTPNSFANTSHPQSGESFDRVCNLKHLSLKVFLFVWFMLIVSVSFRSD